MTVTVIDYGRSNTLSVRRAFETLGCTVELTASRQALLDARALILPGVGAFGDGMETLGALGLAEAIREKAAAGTPLLGICLGMQLLFDKSEEFGTHPGLGLVPGEVVRLPGADTAGNRQRVPHIGWDPLLPPAGRGSFKSVLGRTKPGSEVYFVHSYEAKTNPEYRLADTLYGGRRVSAFVRRGNVFGAQFHPEKSGAVGLAILRQFLSLCESA